MSCAAMHESAHGTFETRGNDVCLSGKSGSRRYAAKPTRMTRSCHHNARWEASVVVNHVPMPTSGSLTAQVRTKLDHSRILTHIVDPGRIDDHVLSWEPIVVISQIVIDPIAVVVDVGLCELHAGKRYARGRVGQLLTRPHFLNLHSSGGNGGDLAVAHFGKDIGFLPSRMDLVLAILFDFFAKKVFSVEMTFLLREGDARRVDRGGCRDQSKCETPIDHQFSPLEMIFRPQRRQEFL